MLSSTFLVVAAFVVASLANPVNKYEPVAPHVDYGNANIWIDLVLFNVNRKLPDSVPIPDLGGPFNFHECFMLGTEKGIKRDGDATVVITENTAKFQTILKMQEVGLTCKWRYLLMSGHVTGTSALLDISAAFAVITESGQHPYVTEFRVSYMDPIKSDVTGLTGAFNWLAEDIIDLMMKSLQDYIIYAIENTLRDVFQSVLDTMIIP